MAGAVGAATDSVISSLAADFAGAATQLMETLTGFWLDLPTPVVDGQQGVAVWLQERTWMFVVAAAVAGVLVAALRTALSRDRGSLRDMARGLVWLVLVTSAGAFVVTQLVAIADLWASWIYEEAVGDESINLGLGVASTVSPGLVLLMALAAALVGMVQIGLMLARAALIPVILGLLPLAAAASMSGTGRQWFGRLIAWLAAFILYKPVAALLYAAAFELSDGRDGVLGMISGVVLLVLAVLALPALMRLIVPATAAIGSANPAAMAAGLAGAAATGAVTVVAAGAAGAGGGLRAAGGRTAAAASRSAGPSGSSPAGPGPRTGGSGGGSNSSRGDGGGTGGSGGGRPGAPSGPRGTGADRSPTATGTTPAGAPGGTGSGRLRPGGSTAGPGEASTPAGGSAPAGDSAPAGGSARGGSGAGRAGPRPVLPRGAVGRVPEAAGRWVSDEQEEQR